MASVHKATPSFHTAVRSLAITARTRMKAAAPIVAMRLRDALCSAHFHRRLTIAKPRPTYGMYVYRSAMTAPPTGKSCNTSPTVNKKKHMPKTRSLLRRARQTPTAMNSMNTAAPIYVQVGADAGGGYPWNAERPKGAKNLMTYALDP